jgi:hypothetical protein
MKSAWFFSFFYEQKNPRQSAGPESFSGILAHLYSGAIDLNSRLSDPLWHGG